MLSSPLRGGKVFFEFVFATHGLCKIRRLAEHRFHSCYELFGERVVSIFNSISHYAFAQPPIGQSDHAVPEGDDGQIPHFLGGE